MRYACRENVTARRVPPGSKRRTTTATSHLVSAVAPVWRRLKLAGSSPASREAGRARPDVPSWRAVGRRHRDVHGDVVRATVLSAAPCVRGVRRWWWPRMRAVRGFVVFTASPGVPDPGLSRIRNEVTLEVTSALNLVSTTVSGYLKFVS